MRESGYGAPGDRNRMPAFPFLLSFLYRQGMDESEFLERAQTFDVNLSIVVLLLLFVVFRAALPPNVALALLASTAFGVFIYRSIHAQAEVLLYFLSFCAFLLFVRMLKAPSWWLAALCGIVAAVAQLSKASLLPAVALWAAVYAGQSFWRGWRHVALLVITLATFLAVLFPYTSNSKRLYGSYFYNVNSTYVMWCDSWDEARAFLNRLESGENIPTEQRPSFQKYLREHSGSDIASRLIGGCRRLLTQNSSVRGFYKYMVFLAVVISALCVWRWNSVRRRIRANPSVFVFVVLLLGVYGVLFAWYNAISTDSRFLLMLFLPAIYSISRAVVAIAADGRVAVGGWNVRFVTAFAMGLASLSAIDVIYNAVRNRDQKAPLASITSVQSSTTSIPLASAARARSAFSAPGFIIMRRGFTETIS